MRGLQQASGLKKLKKKLGLRRFSLGSFSAAGRVFDPGLLCPVIEKLVAKLEKTQAIGKFAGNLVLTAVDGTLIEALPKMAWALWRDDEHRAAKMHLHFDVIRGIPTIARLTTGNGSETKVLQETLSPGRLYLLDRGYCKYELLRQIMKASSSFIVRVRANSQYTILEERPVLESAKKKGIRRDLVVRLGTDRTPQLHEHRLRLVEIHVPDKDALVGRRRKKKVDSKTKTRRESGGDHTLFLVTDLLDLDAELVGVGYQYRWQVELFFRWYKQILQADRLLSLSENGLTIIAYVALMASLLITLWTGRKPTKRTFEMICFYFMGWADEEDLAEHLERLKPTDD
jgi:hypothetical protein